MLDRKIRLVPRQLRRHAHLLQPRLALLPAEMLHEISARAERVGRAFQQIAPAIAVEIDAVIEIMRRQKLHLPELAGERPDHLLGRQVAALDDFQRRDQLRTEQMRPAAIERQRRQRAQRGQVSNIAAEIGLQPPERDDRRRRHAILVLDALEGGGELLDALGALVEAIFRDHAVGEFQKRLREHALAAVLRDDVDVVGEIRRGGRERVLRNAGGDGFAAELREPGIEISWIAAGLRQCRQR